jgi:hypothetical protein
MVESAEQAAVAGRCSAAVGAWPQVMDVASDRGPVAAREPTAPIPAGHGPADLHRNSVGGRSHVQRKADGGGRPGLLSAQHGCQAAWAGQQLQRVSYGQPGGSAAGAL